MPAKTNRITLLSNPDFKAFLAREARSERVSLSALIRSRCRREPNEEERVLLALTKEMRKAIVEARIALAEGLAAAQEALSEINVKTRASSSHSSKLLNNQ